MWSSGRGRFPNSKTSEERTRFLPPNAWLTCRGRLQERRSSAGWRPGHLEPMVRAGSDESVGGSVQQAHDFDVASPIANPHDKLVGPAFVDLQMHQVLSLGVIV